MAKKRRTEADRRHDRQVADQREWAQLKPKLEAVQNVAEARAVLAQTVRPDAPGRQYYSNFGFFLSSFIPPFGASGEELSIYLAMVRRFNEAGDLKPGALVKVVEAFQSHRANH